LPGYGGATRPGPAAAWLIEQFVATAHMHAQPGDEMMPDI
jgi:hypothetical protein